MGRARAEASAEIVVRMVVSEESEKARAQPGNELELSGMDRKQEVSVTVADASDPANDFAESKPKRGTSVDVECSLRANVRAARTHLFRSCRHQFFPFIRFLESALFLSFSP